MGTTACSNPTPILAFPLKGKELDRDQNCRLACTPTSTFRVGAGS